jgi:hypothetical protein
MQYKIVEDFLIYDREMLCRIVFKKHMHGENIMVKKSKTSVKEEIIAPVKEETLASSKNGEKFDFFYILAGGGALLMIILIIFIILRYVLHIV